MTSLNKPQLRRMEPFSCSCLQWNTVLQLDLATWVAADQRQAPSFGSWTAYVLPGEHPSGLARC